MAGTLPRIVWTFTVCVIVAMGCQAEPSVDTEPLPERTESRTAKPSMPELPAEAERDDYVGAVAFVEHYYELAEYGEKTGDWKALKAVSASECDGCQRFWDDNSSRTLDYDDFSSNGPSLNDLIGGIAQVNVTLDDRERLRKDGKFNLSWADSVRCVFEDGRWKVISIDSETY